MTIARVVRNIGSVAAGGGVGDLTVTYNVAQEDSEGHGGGIAWQTAFLMNDGRICSFGTGDHGFESSNAMRIIDPVTTPGTVTASVMWPWTQDIDPPDSATGNNRYVSNHDNHPSLYIPSENKAIWGGHGVFDFVEEEWTYGNRTPSTQTWDDFLDITEVPNAGSVYNPATAWCSALNIGVWHGNSAGGFGHAYDETMLIERTGAGNTWRINNISIAGVKGVMRSRNESVCVGTILYLIGNEWVGDDNTTGPPFMQKIDLETRELLDDLTPPTRDEDEDFPLTVYDADRQRLVHIGIRLQEYDLTSGDAWVDITPDGWPGYTHPMGVYHPTMQAIYFRGTPVGAGVGVTAEKFQWHRIEFDLDDFSRWTLVSTDTDASPFKGPPEEGFGGTKHVWMTWVPTKERVYTFGGDYGNGAGQFSQPNMGSNFTTNEPSGANTFARDSSLCNDQYSIDPYASGTVPWRLEHPYRVRDMGGGTRESRPGRPDQVSMPWDPVRSKLWGFQTKVRYEDGFIYEDGGLPDLWANGDMTLSATPEPDGTWSFAPGASGSPGTWTRETSNCIIYRASAGGTSMSGSNVVSNRGDERIGLITYDSTNDVFGCVSAFQGQADCAVFIFKPVSKTVEYRLFSVSGYSRMDCSCSYCAFIDGWAHVVAIATTGGTRKSVMLRVNMTAALALSNGGTLSSSDYEVIDLPWSLSPGNVWENGNDASSKWQEHAGVINAHRKVVIVKSYEGIEEDSVTKLAIWDPDTRLFSVGQTPPENVHANAWCWLPDTGEVFMAHNTSGSYSNLKAWRYRVT